MATGPKFDDEYVAVGRRSRAPAEIAAHRRFWLRSSKDS